VGIVGVVERKPEELERMETEAREGCERFLEQNPKYKGDEEGRVLELFRR
jgi:hypothetical protein